MISPLLPPLSWMKQPYNWRYGLSSEISYTSPGILTVLARTVCSQNRVDIKMEWRMWRERKSMTPDRPKREEVATTFPFFPCHELWCHCQQERKSSGKWGRKRQGVRHERKKVPNRDNRARSPWNKITNLTLLHLLPWLIIPLGKKIQAVVPAELRTEKAASKEGALEAGPSVRLHFPGARSLNEPLWILEEDSIEKIGLLNSS